jgi:tetratricopeptide (TPR) repeat protein
MHITAGAWADALTNMRKAGEAACKLILISAFPENRANNEIAERNYGELLERIIRNQLVPSEVLNCLKTLQIHGNKATHDDTVEQVDAEMGLSALVKLSGWVHSDLLGLSEPEEVKQAFRSAEPSKRKSGHQIKREQDAKDLRRENARIAAQLKATAEQQKRNTGDQDRLMRLLEENNARLTRMEEDVLNRNAAAAPIADPIIATERERPASNKRLGSPLHRRKVLLAATAVVVLMTGIGYWLWSPSPRPLVEKAPPPRIIACDSISVLLMPLSVLRDDPSADIRFMDALKLRIDRSSAALRLPVRVMLADPFERTVATYEEARSAAQTRGASMTFFGEIQEPTLNDSAFISIKFAFTNELWIDEIPLHGFRALNDTSALAILDECAIVVLFAITEMHLGHGRPSQALAVLNSCKPRTLMNLTAVDYYKCKAHWALGDTTQALLSVERTIALQPDEPYFHGFKGDLLKSRHDMAGAEASYNRCLQLEPANAPILIELAEVIALRSKGDRVAQDQAIELLNRSIVIDSTQYKGWAVLAELEKELDQWDLALIHLKKAYQLDSTRAPTCLSLANELAFRYERPKDAEKIVLAVLRRDSLNDKAILLLAGIYTHTALKDPTKANALYSRGRTISKRDTFDLHLGRSKLAADRNDHVTALNEALAAWAIDSSTTDLGMYIVEQGSLSQQYALAIHMLQDLYRRDSFNVDVNRNLSELHWKGPKEYRDDKKAIRHLCMALNTDRENMNVLADLGELYFRTKDWLHSELVLKELLRLKPKDAKAYETISIIQAKTGRMEEAMTNLSRAIELNPTADILQYNMAALLLKIDERNAPIALVHGLRALELAPSAENEILVAKLYFQVGNYLEAAEHYRSALEKNPKSAAYDPTLATELRKKGVM